jgi:hypothetical protein
VEITDRPARLPNRALTHMLHIDGDYIDACHSAAGARALADYLMGLGPRPERH